MSFADDPQLCIRYVAILKREWHTQSFVKNKNVQAEDKGKDDKEN